MIALLTLFAFAVGVATPIAAWNFATYRPSYDAKDVSLMKDGSLQTGDGAFSGERVRGLLRILFYVRHPRAVRPLGNGDLWVMERQPMPPITVRFVDENGKEIPDYAGTAHWVDEKGLPLK